jgi:hypothetical protein
VTSLQSLKMVGKLKHVESKINNSMIPLIQLAEDQTDAKIANITYCRVVCILTSVLTGNFLLLLQCLGCADCQNSVIHVFGCLCNTKFVAFKTQLYLDNRVHMS